MEESIPRLEVETRKLEIDVKSLGNAQEARKTELNVATTELAAIEKETPRMEALRREVESIEARLRGLQEEMKAYEAKLRDLDAMMNQVGGKAIQSKRNEVNEVTKQAANLQKALSSARVQIRSSTKLIGQLKEENERIEKDIADAEQAIQAAKVQFERIEEEAKKVLVAFEEAKKLMEAKQKELESIEKELQKAKRSNSEKEKELGQFEEKKAQFEKQLGILNEQTAIWTSKIATLRKKTWENTKELDEFNESNESNETPESNVGENDAMDVEPSRDIESEMLRIIPNVSEEELQSVDKARVERSILRLESERDHLKKTVNLGAIAEFRQKDKEYRKREKELDAITNERDRVRKEFDDLRKKRLTEFMDGFNTITLKLKEMYQMITLGGDAELELVDSLDPFAEGIVFSVRPPKKSWKNISNLSGGEKTLSSLALVFALHHYKPTPLYIMDEIDAALDFRNVSIVAHYIKERTKNAQFIVISLRNNMFEMANRLVGIYKTDNCTDSVAINPHELGQQM